MRKLLYKIGKYLSVRYCPHKNKEEVFICYEEGYYKDECLDCGKFVYEGLYDNIITTRDE